MTAPRGTLNVSYETLQPFAVGAFQAAGLSATDARIWNWEFANDASF